MKKKLKLSGKNYFAFLFNFFLKKVDTIRIIRMLKVKVISKVVGGGVKDGSPT